MKKLLSKIWKQIKENTKLYEILEGIGLEEYFFLKKNVIHINYMCCRLGNRLFQIVCDVKKKEIVVV